jgi:hypothetical protein
MKDKAIINRNETFGTLNGVITKNSEILSLVNKHIKQGTAKKLVDNDETLMYELGEQSPIHPIILESLKPFGIK